MSEPRDLSILATRREIRLATSFDHPPIPVRHYDWSAYDDRTADIGMTVGNGSTENEAINDLLERLEEEDEPYPDRESTEGVRP